MSHEYTSPADHRALVNGHRETANTPTNPCPDCGAPVGPCDGQADDGACWACSVKRARALDADTAGLQRTPAPWAKSAGMDAVVLDMIALRIAEALKRLPGVTFFRSAETVNLTVNLAADLRTIALHVESSGRKVEGL